MGYSLIILSTRKHQEICIYVSNTRKYLPTLHIGNKSALNIL